MNELVRIINGALRLDVDKVRNYTAFLAEKLEGAGEKSTADRLRKMLTETDNQLRPADVRFSRALPVDAESAWTMFQDARQSRDGRSRVGTRLRAPCGAAVTLVSLRDASSAASSSWGELG